MISHKAVRTVATVIETGSFEIAANQLGLTPSAISHRIKLLEEQLGTVLIHRATPCTATPAGEKVHAYLQTISLLERDLQKDLGINSIERTTVRIAVNADSLGTWFLSALAQNNDDFLFDVIIEDQEVTGDLIKNGTVVGALGLENHPIAGCDELHLGALIYRAYATPAFCKKWFSNGITKSALESAPSLRFSPNDKLQDKWVAKYIAENTLLPVHKLPSFSVFLDACLSGLGWGMLPIDAVTSLEANGKLVQLQKNTEMETQLVWRWIRSTKQALAPLNKAIRTCAQNSLVQRKDHT